MANTGDDAGGTGARGAGGRSPGAKVRVLGPSRSDRRAHVVALCTHAESALLDPATIVPGTHVSPVGSAAELPPELAHADVVVVEWRDSVAVPPPAGAAELQSLDPADVVELGDLLGGRTVGRTGGDQVTVYKSTGHAVQDIASARLVYDAAIAAGVGVDIAL